MWVILFLAERNGVIGYGMRKVSRRRRRPPLPRTNLTYDASVVMAVDAGRKVSRKTRRSSKPRSHDTTTVPQDTKKVLYCMQVPLHHNTPTPPLPLLFVGDATAIISNGKRESLPRLPGR